MRLFRWKACLPMAALAAVLGLFCALLLKNPLYERSEGGVAELDARARQLLADNEILNQRVEALSEELWKAESAKFSEAEATRYLEEQIEALRRSAGLTELKGPGVRITLANRAQEGALLLVSDEDVLQIINELNASGAEALAINGERFIATTEIRRAGDFVSINARHYSAPFEILAIGNAQTLYAAMFLYGGAVERLERWVDIRVEMGEEISVPAYRGA
ncbi:MAG: DUF881 domain-containing protein [Christensenellaceae bacterium]|nr:DUF881 domain-containing protein [Christensenellaceae bacterium]